MNINIPDWFSKSFYHWTDGFYNKKHLPVPFPGYIDSNDHPFTYVHASRELVAGQEYTNNSEYQEYLKNLKTQPKDWKYRNKKVKYTVNPSGYRTYHWNDIKWTDSIVILGCSCTFGIGISDEETISYKLEQLTGKKVINLGVPAGSNSLILNNLAIMLKKFGMPRAVIINWTTMDRFRFYHQFGYHDSGPWDYFKKMILPHEGNRVNVSKLWNLNFQNETNASVNTYYLSLQADAMLESRTNYLKISFFEETAHFTRSHEFFEIDNGARDLIHPGEENSKQVANYIYNRIKNSI